MRHRRTASHFGPVRCVFEETRASVIVSSQMGAENNPYRLKTGVLRSRLMQDRLVTIHVIISSFFERFPPTGTFFEAILMVESRGRREVTKQVQWVYFDKTVKLIGASFRMKENRPLYTFCISPFSFFWPVLWIFTNL